MALSLIGSKDWESFYRHLAAGSCGKLVTPIDRAVAKPADCTFWLQLYRWMD